MNSGVPYLRMVVGSSVPPGTAAADALEILSPEGIRNAAAATAPPPRT
jgi:hypothetical protein